MLPEIPDIYLIVTPEPSDAFISQRKEAIKLLATDDAMREHFPAWIEFVHFGLPIAAAETGSSGVSAIVQAIQAQQPSFPTDPLERLLDLRVTAAVSLLQYLVEPPPDNGSLSCVVSAVVLATSKLRLSWKEARYGSLIHRLRTTAQSVLDEEAASMREHKKRPAPDVKGGDANTLAASINTALTALGRAVAANNKVDREELQILWWAFGRTSSRLQSAYADLSAGDAAIAAAADLANLMLLPPIPAASDLLRATVETKPRLSLTNLIAQASLKALSLLEPSNLKVKSLVRQRPSLLPLTWLAGRLIESDRSPWEAEFEKVTQLAPASEHPTSVWAEQFLAERVACALIERDWKEAEGT